MSNGTSISSDLINRRLGGGGQKVFYEPELATAEEDQSDGSGLSGGFIALIAVVFVAVGGGTYYFESLGLSWYDVELVVGDLSRFRL